MRVLEMDYTEEFMLFWKAFPGRYHEAGRPKADGGYENYWKIGKRKAMAEWSKLSDYQKKWAMYSVKFMRKGKYVPDPHRWLKHGNYEDIDLPEERATLPKELVPNLKQVESCTINFNDKRNEQHNKLRAKG